MLMMCILARYRVYAYLNVSRGYHAQASTWEPGWRDAIGNDALRYGPFSEPFMLFARPPIRLHFDWLLDCWILDRDREMA